jgi:hypothetical protein
MVSISIIQILMTESELLGQWILKGMLFIFVTSKDVILALVT